MSDGWDADTIVVGAGPAGVGVGVALSHLDLDVLLLERDAVGASLRSWPEEMRFITPSFPSNGFDLPDLNAIVPETSPAVAVDRDGECRFETGDSIDRRFFEDFAQYGFDTVEPTLDVPVAIFHGSQDDSVDVAHSFEAAAQLETDVLLETFATEGHLFSSEAEERLLERTFHWLETQ